MKKERTQGFVSGILVSALVFSLLGTAAATIGSRTLTADYNDIKIELNGQQLTPTDAAGNPVEPFAVNGTTYLPVRAVGDALGIDVDWDGATSTVLLSSSPDITTEELYASIDKMGFYKILQQSFDKLETFFDGEVKGLMPLTINKTLQSGPYAGMTFYEADKEQLASSLMLVESHYEACDGFLSDDDLLLVFEYRRLNSLANTHNEAFFNNPNMDTSTTFGVAGQASVDCMGLSGMATNGFWAEYQSTFD